VVYQHPRGTQAHALAKPFLPALVRNLFGTNIIAHRHNLVDEPTVQALAMGGKLAFVVSKPSPGLPGIGRQRQLEQEGGSLAPGLFLLLVHARLSLLICSSTLSRQTVGAGVTCKMPSCQFTPHLSTHSLAVSEKRQCLIKSNTT
jgi:hypothetical protein